MNVPERPLSDAILDFAGPLIEALGPQPAPEEVRDALDAAVRLWNALIWASPVWERPDPKPLAALRKTLGNDADAALAQSIDGMSRRWRTDFEFDPRLVESWSVTPSDSGAPVFVCEVVLPGGVVAHVPPPAEKRIAIGGKFLDEVRIRQGRSSFLSFPVSQHRGAVGDDGVATIYAKMPTVVALFAEGLISPVGGPPTEVMVGRKRLGPMVLKEVACLAEGGHNDVALLVFHPVPVAVDA